MKMVDNIWGERNTKIEGELKNEDMISNLKFAPINSINTFKKSELT